jgi:hypothetical protein
MARKAHYARPEDQDLTDALFRLYSLSISPLGKGAGSGNASDAVGEMVFVGCQSQQAVDDGNWPLKGDSHRVRLGIDELKEVHKRIKQAGADGEFHRPRIPGEQENGLLRMLEIFEAVAGDVERKTDGDFNPLYNSIPAGSDLALAAAPE